MVNARKEYITKMGNLLASGNLNPQQIQQYLHHMWDTAESDYTRRQAAKEALPESNAPARAQGGGLLGAAEQVRKTTPSAAKTQKQAVQTQSEPEVETKNENDGWVPRPEERKYKSGFKAAMAPFAHAAGSLLSHAGSLGGVNQPKDAYDPLHAAGEFLTDVGDAAVADDQNAGVVTQAWDMIHQLGLDNAPAYTHMNLLMRLIDQKNAALADRRLKRRVT
jgi:hypothetical protein